MAVANFNVNDIHLFTFDVWNTLIKANPEFSRLRTAEIAKAYGITFEEAKEAYTSVKHFLDQSAEIASICMSTPQCWQLLDVTINRLRRKQGLIAVDVGIEELSARCNELFRQNLPIFTEETKEVLLKLKAAGKGIGIISNTNFIPGKLLWDTLFKDLNVFNLYPIFSDSHGDAKPHQNVFSHARVWGVSALRTTIDVEAHKVKCLHVGDNLICDGAADKMFGYKFQHVTNPDNLVEIFKSVGL